MTDDWKKTVHRNKLLGMWAAEKLGITGQDAEDYSDALAVGTLDPERSDVLSKIRKDFHAAGVVQSDEQILRVMNQLMLQAGSLMPGTRGDALDALTVLLARKLADMSRHSANIKSLHRRQPHEKRDSRDRIDEQQQNANEPGRTPTVCNQRRDAPSGGPPLILPQQLRQLNHTSPAVPWRSNRNARSISTFRSSLVGTKD
jgi:hypothetical protein